MTSIRYWDAASPEAIPEGFWSLLELGKKDDAGFNAALRELNRGTLMRFIWVYRDAIALLKDEDHLAHLPPGASEDTVHEFAMWMVAQGKEYYLEVYHHPEAMPSEINRRDAVLGILSTAVREYRRRYNEPVPENP